jgi:predicted metal-dependent peptidase
MASAEGISKVTIQLLLKEPFYGHYLMGVPKSFQSEIPTAAVRLYKKQMVQLIINETFWNSLSPTHQYGLLKHEVLHIALQHLFLSKEFNNQRLFNIAADLVVNQYILAEQLPEGGITLDHFRPLESIIGYRLEKEKGVHYYYQALLALLHHIPSPSPNSSNGSANQTSLSPEEKEALDWFKKIIQEENQELSKHDRWNEISELSQAEINVMVQQYKNVLRSALQRSRLKSQGHLPGSLLQQFDHLLLEEHKVNWRRVLRIFGATSTSSYIKNTIRRPSKRFGVVPGIKIKRRQQLLVALDTSGSVGISDIEQFFNEIRHLYKTGADITVAECDAQLHAVYRYTGKTPESVHGRGGTSFAPVLELANKLRPDGLIYLTDGGASMPESGCRVPVLWVFTPGCNNQSLIGRKVEMNY